MTPQGAHEAVVAGNRKDDLGRGRSGLVVARRI